KLGKGKDPTTEYHRHKIERQRDIECLKILLEYKEEVLHDQKKSSKNEQVTQAIEQAALELQNIIPAAEWREEVLELVEHGVHAGRERCKHVIKGSTIAAGCLLTLLLTSGAAASGATIVHGAEFHTMMTAMFNGEMGPIQNAVGSLNGAAIGMIAIF